MEFESISFEPQSNILPLNYNYQMFYNYGIPVLGQYLNFM